MKSIGYIIQTCSLGLIFIILWKIVSHMRKLLLKAALKIRKNYNIKHKLPPNSGFGQIDATSLSYQMDSIEAYFALAILFLMSLLFSLFVPLPNDNLFCTISMILSIVIFCYCWCVRKSATTRYQVFVFIACGSSLLLGIHIVASLVVGTKVLISYTNSVNGLLHIWFTTLMYKLLVDKRI